MIKEKENKIPRISKLSIQEYLKAAVLSERKRACKVLHNKGASFNRVFNFICLDSFMQPHLHPGAEKEENIYCVQGELAVIFFDNIGDVEKISLLKKNMSIQVPAYKWHTYVMLTKFVVTYETMMGVYDTQTWKKMSDWSPIEGSKKATEYLLSLRQKVFCESIK